MSTTSDETNVPQGFGGAVYERPDTDAGFITDSTEIMQLKAVRKSDIINSELLGDFDEFGVYSIDPKIVVELVRLKKRITLQNEFGTFCEASVEGKTFHFRITPTKQVEQKLVSQLELLEEIYHANGYIINTRTTLLATYSFEPVPDFDALARQMFFASANPDDDFDETGDDGALKPEFADYIKHRLAYLRAMELVSGSLYEKLEEAYFKKRIKILNDIPEATVVLAEYKKQFSKVEHFFVNNSKHKYRAMNDILTSVIEGAKGEKLRRNSQYREQMKEANRIYLKTVRQIDESVKRSMEVIEAVANSMPIEETPEIKKAGVVVAKRPEQQKTNETNSYAKKSAQKPAKKSGGKKSGSKSDKKKDNKKKDDKKKDDKKKPVAPSKLTPSEKQQSVDINEILKKFGINQSKQDEIVLDLGADLSAEMSGTMASYKQSDLKNEEKTVAPQPTAVVAGEKTGKAIPQSVEVEELPQGLGIGRR